MEFKRTTWSVLPYAWDKAGRIAFPNCKSPRSLSDEAWIKLIAAGKTWDYVIYEICITFGMRNEMEIDEVPRLLIEVVRKIAAECSPGSDKVQTVLSIITYLKHGRETTWDNLPHTFSMIVQSVFPGYEAPKNIPDELWYKLTTAYETWNHILWHGLTKKMYQKIGRKKAEGLFVEVAKKIAINEF